MKRQVMVIGLGRFGSSLASALANLGYEVLAIDKDEKRTQDISSHVAHAVQADPTEEEVLEELEAGSFDIGIVAIGGQIENNVLCTILLKKFEIPYIISRAENELHGSILNKIGADLVVYPERDAGTRLAQIVRSKYVNGYMHIAQDYGVARISIPSFVKNKSLSQLGLSKSGKNSLSPVLIHKEKELILNPEVDEQVTSGDTLVVSGSGDNIDKLLEKIENEYPDAEEKERRKKSSSRSNR